MIRAPRFVLVTLLVACCAGLLPAAAQAGRSRYLLHIQGRLGEHAHLLDLAIPWKPDKGGSPFDFTTDVSDAVTLDRLRKTWSALQRVPEGTEVEVQTSSEKLSAWKRGGYLVLEPHRAEGGGLTRVKIPDYIVNTILAHDGRLTDEDIDHLARERGKVTIVRVISEKGELSVWVDKDT